MKPELKQMLNKYAINNPTDRKNAVNEIIQEAVLCSLSRAGFFKEAAFYGGTALRIFYGLDRFSEDLDFSLIAPNPDFDLKTFFPAVQNGLTALGLNFRIEEKIKTKESDVKSAFVKGNTRETMLIFYENIDNEKINPDQLIKVKFELDTNPPPYATYECRFGMLPYPYQVRIYDEPSLFAGKMHAVIARSWRNRIKGRDLYDYVFYLARGTKVNIRHLKARLVQTGQISEDFDLTEDSLKQMLAERFKTIDYEKAKMDVLPFLSDDSKLDIWSVDFFTQITENLKAN